jgi:hypothetical protein
LKGASLLPAPTALTTISRLSSPGLTGRSSNPRHFDWAMDSQFQERDRSNSDSFFR